MEAVDDPTILETQYKIETLDDSSALQLDFYESGLAYWSSKVEAVAFVFSLTSQDSFEHLLAIETQITNNRGSTDYPKVIVANKIDLDGERVVSGEAVARLAAQWDCSYFESSAKNNVGVDVWVHHIAQKVQTQRQLQPPPPQAPSRSCIIS